MQNFEIFFVYVIRNAPVKGFSARDLRVFPTSTGCGVTTIKNNGLSPNDFLAGKICETDHVLYCFPFYGTIC